jgi:16S rRNA (uracil1498-N3)-methyltransferase
MSLKRFFGDASKIKQTKAGDYFELSSEEQKHARVARLRQGEGAEIIDGSGNVLRGVCEKDGLRVKEVLFFEKQKPEIILAIGLTQGSTFELIIRQATEFGVSSIIPLQTKFSATWEDSRAEHKQERRERIIDEACKQSGLYWRPQLLPVMKPAEVFSSFNDAIHLVASLQEPREEWSSLLNTRSEKIIAWVGPEGDFSPEEYLTLKEAGAKFVSLGATVLKTETACVAMLSRCGLLHALTPKP